MKEENTHQQNESAETYIKHFINYHHASPYEIRRFTLLFTFLFIELLFPFFITINTYDPHYLFGFVPIIAIMNLFAVYMLINPAKRQLTLSLFMGSIGIAISLGSLIFAQKAYYSEYGGTSPLFLILSTCVMIAGILLVLRWHTRLIMSGYYWKLKTNRPVGKLFKSKWAVIVIAIFGVVMGLTSHGKHPHTHGTITPLRDLIELLNFSVLFDIIGTLLLVLFLQRYFLTLKHRDWYQVTSSNPTKKKRKGA